MDSEIELMQRLEKSLTYIKNFFNKLKFYFWKVSPFIFWISVCVTCIVFYEDFFKWVFSRSVPITTLYDYVESQPIFWKTTINRIMFVRPAIRSKTWDLGYTHEGIYQNRSKPYWLVKWGWYNDHHFADTLMFVLEDHFDRPVLWHPKYWNARWPLYRESYRRAVYKTYRFARQDIDRIWPRVPGDELELLIRYKWFHNIFEFPFALIIKNYINPFINFFIEPAYQFFAVVNFKQDFIYRLPEEGYGSLFLIPIIKFIININIFFKSTFSIDYIQYFLNEIFFYKFKKFFYTYILYCDLLGCNWVNIFYSFSKENAIIFLNVYFNHILWIFYFLVFKFFSLFWPLYFLNSGVELIFLEKFFFLSFSYLFTIFLFKTIFNKYFWFGFNSLLEWICCSWNDNIYVVLIISCKKLLSIFTFLPFQLWKYLLRRYLTKDVILKIVAFLRRNYKKYLWYKELALDIYSGEVWLRKYR